MKCDLCGCERDLAHYCLDALKKERDYYKVMLESILDIYEDRSELNAALAMKMTAEMALREFGQKNHVE